MYTQNYIALSHGALGGKIEKDWNNWKKGTKVEGCGIGYTIGADYFTCNSKMGNIFSLDSTEHLRIQQTLNLLDTAGFSQQLNFSKLLELCWSPAVRIKLSLDPIVVLIFALQLDLVPANGLW